ncbi:MAG TPA: altronate dehydratase family protein [Edaphobacter sp.]|nr:altronate dehydratase family protein [Edaphobacter sp.]
MSHQTLKLGSSDDVVVALKPLAAGQSLNGLRLTAASAIPAGHKLAIHPIAPGQPVRKFNQIIGFATQPIAIGELVHSHNLVTGDFERDYAIGSDSHATKLLANPATFQGIVRPNGRVATRNYVGILTTVNCSATVARRIAAHFTPEVLSSYPNVDGVVTITHGTGCGMAEHGEPADLLRRVFVGYANHPNFAGVLLLGLGCETNQIEPLINLTGPGGLTSPGSLTGPGGLTSPTNTLRTSTIQEEGGTASSIKKGIATVFELLEQANRVTRTTVSSSNLVLGLQCGGSDAYSGISANPALGAAVDILIRNGGTAILSETPEIYGAEHLLTRRSSNPEVAQRLIDRIHWWEEYTARHKGSIDNNPQPGNKTGGLTTILEKSLGAVSKAGTTNLNDVFLYAEPIHTPGLVFMDSPGFDPVSATGQVASGANVICFTTGRGSVFGCKPTPSLKIASNTTLYNRMSDDMDINCGTIIDGEETVEQAGARIFEEILAMASGKLTRSEVLGFGEEEFQPWLLGATL